MTTQVRPLAGGAWNTVTLHPHKAVDKTTVLGTTLPVPLRGQALAAMNSWVNAGGSGTAAVRAQKTAAAVRLQLQEI